MIRAMMTEFPESPELYAADDQYMLGGALLVKPVTRPLTDGGGRTEVLLPPGGWYDLQTGKYLEGGRKIQMETPLGRIPVLIRAGSILPVAEAAGSTADMPFLPAEIQVLEGADSEFLFYNDTGDGYGEGTEIPMRYRSADASFTLGEAAGAPPEAGTVTVRFTRKDGRREIRQAVYDGREIRIDFSDR